MSQSHCKLYTTLFKPLEHAGSAFMNNHMRRDWFYIENIYIIKLKTLFF